MAERGMFEACTEQLLTAYGQAVHCERLDERHEQHQAHDRQGGIWHWVKGGAAYYTHPAAAPLEPLHARNLVSDLNRILSEARRLFQANNLCGGYACLQSASDLGQLLSECLAEHEPLERQRTPVPKVPTAPPGDPRTIP